LTDQRTHLDLTPPGNHQDSAAVVNGHSIGSNQLLWALIGFVVALTIVVILVLPYLVDRRSTEDTSTSIEANTQQPKPLVVSVSRHDAELELQKFLRLQGRPGLAGAEKWAADGWQVAVKTATDGDDLYGKGQFHEALTSYKSATLKLQALLQDRPQYLTDNLATGQAALQENNSVDAMAAFERVLAMQKNHVTAAAGLRRASVRSDVLALMVQGRQAETENNLQQATVAYRSALSLDPGYLPAQQASQQMKQRVNDLEFQQAMSLVLKNLEQQRLQTANNALKKAAGIYPNHPAVVDARSRLVKAKRGSTLNSLRRQATHAVSREDWKAAIMIYRKAISYDRQAAFAVSGLAYSQQQAQLHEQLRHYLADSSRLYSDEPLANARRLLAANKHVSDKTPVLAGMLLQLQEDVRLALIPVDMILYSDQKTQVVIYHVGRLGQFEEKRISLRPGDYTVTGSCPGFRDVRKVLKLRPGVVIPPLLVRCEEPV
jgi:tetratricopeptide (TPR) repeat protein